MIRGFEDITFELTAEEVRVAKIIKVGFELHVGKKNAVAGVKMRKWLLQKHKIKLSGVRLRKIIHALRVSGEVRRLISTSRGYYIAQTRKEVEDYCVSLAQRAASITEVKQAMVEDLNDSYQVKLKI